MKTYRILIIVILLLSEVCIASYSTVLEEIAGSEKNHELKVAVSTLAEQMERLEFLDERGDNSANVFKEARQLKALFDSAAEGYGLGVDLKLLIASKGDDVVRRLVYIDLAQRKPKLEEIDDVARIVKLLDHQEQEDENADMFTERSRLSQERVYTNLVEWLAVALHVPVEERRAALDPGKRGCESLEAIFMWIISNVSDKDIVAKAENGLKILKLPINYETRTKSKGLSKREPRFVSAQDDGIEKSGQLNAQHMRVGWYVFAAIIFFVLGISCLFLRGRSIRIRDTHK